MGADDALTRPEKSPAGKKTEGDASTALLSDATPGAASFSKGQVARMNLPEHWQKGQSAAGISGVSFFQEFHPQDSPQAQIGFFYRGHRTSDVAGHAFLDVLNAGPQSERHFLNEKDLASIAETLDDKSNDDFEVKHASAEMWNGKRVMVVEGRYKDCGKDVFEIFTDTDGTGTAVQEIYYEAPSDQYPKYFDQAKAAIKSIRWQGMDK
jgi:hypothetical protein